MHTRDPAFTEDLHGPEMRLDDEDDARPPRRRRGAPRGALALALVGALVGAAFSALSTSDFMQHLDRQVHAIHCSFLPGAGKDIAESGCRTVMMSPYSSLFREMLWGGVPISLWALAVFAFLAYRAGLLIWRGRATSGETKVLLASASLPVVVSVAYAVLSVYKLDALCKICVGVYAASAACFAGAMLAHRARGTPYGEARFGPALLEGAGLVAALTVAYVLLAPQPDAKTSIAGCGSLVRGEDGAGVMIPLVSKAGGTPSVEVLDPLCPSCKAFDARLAASSFAERLDLKAVLFPLDPACNWMVTEAIHPGACAVSEAVLCAAGLGPGPKDAAAADAVLEWAFSRQAELRTLAARDESALRGQIEREFPAVKGCLGGALVKSRLTKSLRWAVANAIPVLTPQLFVAGTRLCDEDTDLGLEYTLTRMLSPEAEAERARRRAADPPRVARPPGEELPAVASIVAPEERAARPLVPRAAQDLERPPSSGSVAPDAEPTAADLLPPAPEEIDDEDANQRPSGDAAPPRPSAGASDEETRR